MNYFADIFTEAFLHRLLPLFNEITLGAARHFQQDSYPQLSLIAALGALLASAVLYAIGMWLRRMPKRVSTEAQQARIVKLETAARFWLPWLLFLSPTPMGCVLIIAAGFFAIRVRIAGLVLIAAEIAWRMSPLF